MNLKVVGCFSSEPKLGVGSNMLPFYSCEHNHEKQGNYTLKCSIGIIQFYEVFKG